MVDRTDVRFGGGYIGGEATHREFMKPTAYQAALAQMANFAVNPPLLHDHPTVVAMKRVRRARVERLRALRLRSWWRKVWDGVVYVVTGREP